MSSFRDYTFNATEVTAICTDTANSNYLWIAFKKNSDGNCSLRKVSAFDLSQIYFQMDFAVDLISQMKITNGLIFIAVSHATIMGFAISLSNPLTSQTTINLPGGIVEKPVDIGVGAANVYYLFGGDLSGTNAKIVNVTNSGSFVETIDLLQSAILVKFARGLTVDASENVWVVNDGTPSSLFRVYKISSTWHLAETVLS